jgi:hypothetical protein
VAAVMGRWREGFAEASQDFFVEKRGDKCFLSEGQAGTAMVFGHEITHCLFCGNAAVRK